MPLTPGTRFGPYEVLAPIGAGGMGEVYKARDTRLDREVAIKVLPFVLARDHDRLVRFEREAKVLASLNHPNIAQIYGFEESGDTRALAMELVPGSTLSIPQPLETALNYAKQIADALEAAHEKGFTHRDLKPANIMITPEGVVKVLDFGLAAIPSREGDGADPDNSPTLTMAATHAGTIMGTAAYMSPEQAAGKVVDRRSDIWSFGVVLYEMLVGKRLFDGETISHTLASVLKDTIDFAKLPASTPAPIRQLLKRCLERDVKRRLRDIGEARVTIQDYLADPSPAAEQATAPLRSRLGSAWWMVAASALAIVAAGLGFGYYRATRPVPPARPVRFQIAPPPGVNLGLRFALSPDGTMLTYTATGSDGVLRLWVRSMDTLESRALAGTEGLQDDSMFWSPDSRFIVFLTGGELKKVDVAGGPPQTLCDVPDVLVGGSWNPDGTIIFGTAGNAGIQRVPAAGGTPSPVTAVSAARKDLYHLLPVFLPDGRHFLYFVNSTPENAGIYLGSLDSPPDRQDPRRLVATDIGPGFVPFPDGKGGELLFGREGTLLAQPFDLRRLETTGEAVPVAENLGSYLTYGFFAASGNGTLVYRGGANGGNLQLGWFDRQGKTLGTAGAAHSYYDLALSPDGTRVAAVQDDGDNFDIWLTKLSHGGDTRFTFDPAMDRYPAWSPDGSRIAFSSSRAGQFNLYQHASNGAGQYELLLKSANNKYVNDWSRDGRWLLYDDFDPKTQRDLWVLPMEGERKPVPFLRTSFNEQAGKFSPDVHWIAYQSDDSGRDEIYVRPFPAPADGGGKWMVSQGGGTSPRWRGDGKELFYLAGDSTVMAVPVSASGAAFQPGTPAALFKGPANRQGWDVAADGKRFLFPVPTGGATKQAPFNVVLNWMSLLKK